MSMPAGFQWIPASQYETGEPRALALDGHMVAMLIDRVDGGWFARLEVQKPLEAPLVTRPCSSFSQGRQGCELWASRHEVRLRAEIAEKEARRVRHTALSR